MNKAELFWDRHASGFDDIEKHYEAASRVLISLTKEYLNANDNVLDFGCATGSKTLELADGVNHIHGLDISNEMISGAIKKKDKLNVRNVSFSHGTIFNDDLKKGSYDKILAFSIIHLLEESEKAVQRINELLKPGGLFISETACFREKMDLKTRLAFTGSRFMKRSGNVPLHLNMYRISDVEKLISGQNFKIIKNEMLFFNGMTLSFIVAEKQ